MAHTKSALKRIRQDKRRNLRKPVGQEHGAHGDARLPETLTERDATKTETSLRLASKTLARPQQKASCASRRPRGAFLGWPGRRTRPSPQRSSLARHPGTSPTRGAGTFPSAFPGVQGGIRRAR